MKTYYLKIRDKFISDIKNRIKKHEYRLATPERMQVKIGDTFVLISNQNRDNFVRVTIKGIKIYNSWTEALAENWRQDFKNIFPSLEKTLKECYRFYPKDEVDRYGIVEFEIEPLYIDNYFARKVEQPFLESETVRILRQELTLENKRGRLIKDYNYPRVDKECVKQVAKNTYMIFTNDDKTESPT